MESTSCPGQRQGYAIRSHLKMRLNSLPVYGIGNELVSTGPHDLDSVSWVAFLPDHRPATDLEMLFHPLPKLVCDLNLAYLARLYTMFHRGLKNQSDQNIEAEFCFPGKTVGCHYH